MGLFEEKVCEVEAAGVRYLLRKNEDQAVRQRQRLDDKLRQLTQKVEKRNQQVALSPRCQPPAGLRRLDAWVRQHKLQGLLKLHLQGRLLVLHKDEAALELAGCYVVVTDVPRQALAAQQAHDAYLGLQQVERDFRTFKTGLLEVRPLFGRKQSRTRGDVVCCLLALKLARELERRLHAAFGTTADEPQAVTLPAALAALSRLCLLPYRIDATKTVTLLPRPDSRQTQILKALGVTLPATPV